MRRIHQVYIIALLSITALAFAQVSVNPMNASPSVSASPMPVPPPMQNALPTSNAVPIHNNVNTTVNSNATVQPVSKPFTGNTLNSVSPAGDSKNIKPSNPSMVKPNSLDNGLNATQGMSSAP